MSEASSIDWNGYFAERADRMLAELGSLVEIESPSRDAAAIRVVASHLEHELSSAGAHVEIVDEHKNGPNLLAHFGEGDRPIMLLGHMDTVWPLGTLEKMPWRVEGGLAYGPGVFDMKAGLVQALLGLSRLRDLDGVALLVTSDEEVGSPTSAQLVRDSARGLRAALECALRTRTDVLLAAGAEH